MFARCGFAYEGGGYTDQWLSLDDLARYLLGEEINTAGKSKIILGDYSPAQFIDPLEDTWVYYRKWA